MKKIIAVSAAASFALALAACGSSSDADEEIAGDDVEEVAGEVMADVPESDYPVAVEPAATRPVAEPTETRRRTVEQAADRAESTAADINAAIEAELGQAEDARDAEAQ